MPWLSYEFEGWVCDGDVTGNFNVPDCAVTNYFSSSLSPSSNENVPISSEDNSRTASPASAENKLFDHQQFQAKQEKQKRKMKCKYCFAFLCFALRCFASFCLITIKVR